jgi:hypothetical protein
MTNNGLDRLPDVAQALGLEPAYLYERFNNGVHPCWHLPNVEFEWEVQEWRALLTDPELDLGLPVQHLKTLNDHISG